ncbi:MAG: efflux RND transporter periplasmic adaptor subunit [Planctomycetes bacterium]|nr:efflux RND transporter periplasmic adaptor subunit [Planctomycetota bacterium]
MIATDHATRTQLPLAVDTRGRTERRAPRRFARLVRHPGAWTALAALIAVATYSLLRARGPEVRTVTAVRRDLEQHLVASGRVWVPTRVRISARTSGLVLVVAAVEGQRVRSGDLLLQLDDAAARASVDEAEALVEQATARIERQAGVGAVVAAEELSEAATNLERAEANLVRSQPLATSGVMAKSELEEAGRAVAIARAQWTAANARQRAAVPNGTDARLLVTALVEMRAQLAAARSLLAETRLVALQDATVLTRAVEPGDVVQPGTTLFVLAAEGAQGELAFQADERTFAALQVGQHARASADAYPTLVFDAVVRTIAPSVDPERGSVEVRLVVADAPTYLLPDMTVSIDVTVAAKKDVLTLPSATVHGATTSAPWIFIVRGGRVARATVTLGLRGEGTLELAAPLGEDAAVIVPDGRLLTVGQRVRGVPAAMEP